MRSTTEVRHAPLEPPLVHVYTSVLGGNIYRLETFTELNVQLWLWTSAFRGFPGEVWRNKYHPCLPCYKIGVITNVS